MNIDKLEIAHLTEEYGGCWGINHTRRLIHLITRIGEGQNFNQDVVWVAAHLHDWGAYPKWAQKDIAHAIRSAQVAQLFLSERKYPEYFIKLVLQSIRYHHEGGLKLSIEAILLFDADALDFLGTVGIFRDISRNPKDLRKAYEITKKRRETLPDLLVLEKSREIAASRIEQMDKILKWFEQDSWGCF